LRPPRTTALDVVPARPAARAAWCAYRGPQTADPILFEHGFEHLHPGSHDELGQLGARVDQ
jgi:hypothetical protein